MTPKQFWHLINSATSELTKLEILRGQFYRYCLFWNVLEPPYLILHSFNFTTLMRYLPKKLPVIYPPPPSLIGVSIWQPYYIIYYIWNIQGLNFCLSKRFLNIRIRYWNGSIIQKQVQIYLRKGFILPTG